METPTPTPEPKPVPTPVPPTPAKPTTSVGATIGIVVSTVFFTLALAGGIGWGIYEWWVHSPETPPAPITLAIDPSTPAHVGRRIVIHADTKGTTVKWRVISAPI